MQKGPRSVNIVTMIIIQSNCMQTYMFIYTSAFQGCRSFSQVAPACVRVRGCVYGCEKVIVYVKVLPTFTHNYLDGRNLKKLHQA